MAVQRVIPGAGTANRSRILTKILRQPGISRTQIGEDLQLNAASVSRVCRELIEAGLAEETDRFGPNNRPGRRHVSLTPVGAGGFVVGIGLNAFRQTVTLADLNNTKIAEWNSAAFPGADGEAFIRQCLAVADRMVAEHVPNRARFFGIGVAIAAELDRENQVIVNAPVFNWASPIDVGALVGEVLGVPLALDTPSSSISVGEADFGLARGFDNILTLNCSLGFGIAVRRHDTATRTIHDFGQVLWESRASDGTELSLSDRCGGRGILLDVLGEAHFSRLPAEEVGRTLVETVARSASDPALQDLFREKGSLTARAISLVIDLLRPDCIVFAGPVARSEAYIAGFSDTLPKMVGSAYRLPDIVQSRMTPAGASRLLSLQVNVANANLDLDALKGAEAA